MKKYIQSYRLFFRELSDTVDSVICGGHLRTDSTVRDNRLLPYE